MLRPRVYGEAYSSAGGAGRGGVCGAASMAKSGGTSESAFVAASGQTSRTLTIWKYRESARPMVSTESHLMFDVSCFAWSIMLLFGNHPSRSASPDPARRPGRPASRVGRSARPGPTSPPPSGPERVGRSERTGSKPGSRARPGRSVGDVKCKINFAPPEEAWTAQVRRLCKVRAPREPIYARRCSGCRGQQCKHTWPRDQPE